MNETFVLRKGEVFGSRHYRRSLGGLRIVESRYAPDSYLPEHRHERGNLCLVLAGDFEETFDSATRRCGHARLLYRSPKEVHAQRFGSRGALCVTIEPPAEWMQSGWLPRQGAVDLDGRPALAAIRLYAELRAGSGASARAQARTLAALVIQRIELGGRRVPDWLTEVQRLIGLQWTGRVRSSELARAVGVHPVHLARCFHRLYGYRIADHVRHRRAHAACEAMLGGERSLTRIAARLGFCDQSHLTRAFRSVLGLTPRRFRSVMALSGAA